MLHGSRPGDPEAADKVSLDSVYLLSDGLPTTGPVTETAELSRRVALFNALARVRFHCVGIGEHDQALLRRLAQDSRGSYVVR